MQDLAVRHDRILRHLINVCGMDERDARAALGRGEGEASDRPALTPQGIAVFERSVHKYVASKPLRALLLLLPRTGVRVSEIVTLSWDAILTDQPGQPRLLIVGKNSDVRTIPLTNKALAILERYEAEYNPRARSEHWIFPAKTGPNHIDTDRVQRAVRLLRRREPRLSELTPHVLRHTYATEKLHQCADLATVRQLLGHNGRKTALLYYHI